jgi:hypothetical protein
VEVIKGDVEGALHFPDLQASEQYLTCSQSLAHFLRHSKGRWQRAQTFGAKPFLIFAPWAPIRALGRA